MTNHVHLLLEPETAAGLGALMKRLAGRQTRFVNRQEPRSGTLWEGRYRSSPVQSDTYLLSCLRYIELNPVRARMVASPADYPWSSYACHAGLREMPEWLDTPPAYEELGSSARDRTAKYRAFVSAGVPEQERKLIVEAVQRGHLTGNGRFVEEVEQIIGRRIEQRRRGRPSRRQTA
ncbi:MAG: transposase [Gammaproteobacteria bacterium]|nr:MAG: transposase [Gammaproteobacteria bacterium]